MKLLLVEQLWLLVLQEGLEILEDAENIDAIVVPVGGGGLIAGVALAVKTINPNVQIIGVEPSRCASMAAAMVESTRPCSSGKPHTASGIVSSVISQSRNSVSTGGSLEHKVSAKSPVVSDLSSAPRSVSPTCV